MRILLSNDDGYLAPGIAALYHELAAEHELLVSAPAGECSATGHGLTLREPLRVRKQQVGEGLFFGVTGLPADAVKFGLTVLCEDRRPDLVISGINQGANTGQNLFYSGTVAAAAEGVLAGVPAIAISLASFKQRDFSAAARVAAGLVREFQQHPLPADCLLNVNVPEGEERQFKGYRHARMGYARFHEVFYRREDPQGREYFWLDGAKSDHDSDPESDDHLVHQGWITLTPLKLDLTHPEWNTLLNSWRLG